MFGPFLSKGVAMRDWWNRRILLMQVICIGVFGFSGVMARADELQIELVRIDELRATEPALIDDIDRLGSALLAKYSDPADHGRIYYQMVLTAVQSGIKQNPKRIEHYCQKALELNTNPLDRGSLYCYYGDLLILSEHLGTFEERRRLAADIYLRGLKENLAIALPDGPTELPPVDKLGGLSLPNERPEMQKLSKLHDAQLKARKQAEFLQGVEERRKILAGQLVYIYSLPPSNLVEFQAAARKVLGDSKYIETISQSINTVTAN